MNKKFLAVIIGVLGLMNTKAQAQGMVFVAQDVPSSSYNGVITYPEVLIHVPPMGQDNVKIKNTDFVDKNANAKGQDNKNISYYVQKLNLTMGQMARAQEISDAGRAKHEKLLQKIQKLREQAHELERKDLEAFEALLTDEQKQEFYKLRNEQGEAAVSVENNGEPTSASVDYVPPAPADDAQPAPVDYVPPVPTYDVQPALQPEGPQPYFQPEQQP